MKAVYQNTLISLLCLASVVLAAPTQTIAHAQKKVQSSARLAEKATESIQDQCVDTDSPAEIPLSIEEGTIRFACW